MHYIDYDENGFINIKLLIVSMVRCLKKFLSVRSPKYFRPLLNKVNKLFILNIVYIALSCCRRRKEDSWLQPALRISLYKLSRLASSQKRSPITPATPTNQFVCITKSFMPQKQREYSTSGIEQAITDNELLTKDFFC